MSVQRMIDRMAAALPGWAPIGCAVPPPPDPEPVMQYAPRKPIPENRPVLEPVVIPDPTMCGACGCRTVYDGVCMSPYCRHGWVRGE